MQLRRVRIVGTGKYLPEQEVTDEELDRRLPCKGRVSVRAAARGL